MGQRLVASHFSELQVHGIQLGTIPSIIYPPNITVLLISVEKLHFHDYNLTT